MIKGIYRDKLKMLINHKGKKYICNTRFCHIVSMFEYLGMLNGLQVVGSKKREEGELSYKFLGSLSLKIK